VERELIRIQEALFTAHGLASALALPPVLPIAAITPDTEAERFTRAIEPHRTGFRIGVGALVIREGTVFAAAELDVDGRDRLAAIASAFADDDAPDLPFSVFRGFRIADILDTEAVPALPAQAAPGFSSFYYGLLVVEYLPIEGPWWERVSWQIKAKVSTRRPPKANRRTDGQDAPAAGGAQPDPDATREVIDKSGQG
jgi:hypothetical protein